MRIAVPLTVWQRPEITRAVYRSLIALQTKHEVLISAVGSPEDPHLDEHRDMSKIYGVHFSEYANQPLGAKANARVGAIRDHEWDYMLLLGSDDVVSPNFLDAYEHVFERELPAWDWADCYFYEDGKLYHWRGYDPAQRDESIGAGRIVRRDVVERLNWAPWDPRIDRVLDRSMRDNMRMLEPPVEIPYGRLPEGTYLIDIKSPISITPRSAYVAGSMREVDVPEVMRGYLPIEFDEEDWST